MAGSWKVYFGGDYLNQLGVVDEPTWTIRAIEGANIEDKNTKTMKRKMVVHWDNPDAPSWIPSVTACTCMEAMFGSEDPAAWVGKPVTLYRDSGVMFGRERKGGIRVKGSPILDRPIKVVVKLPQRRPLELTMQPTGRPQQDRQQGAQPASDPFAALTAVLSRHGLTVAHLDTFRASEGKSPIRELSAEQVKRLADYLSGDKGAGMIEAIKAVAND